MSEKQGVSKSGKKIRKLFSQQEDALLTQIMYQQPFETWIAVAEQLPGRTARQCRDRWVNYLSPSNKNGPWSHEEDQLLAEKYLEHGPQWTTIAKFFDGRSENNVKNRWYTYVKSRFNTGPPPHVANTQNQTKRTQQVTPVQPQPVPAYRPVYPVKMAMTPAPQPQTLRMLQQQPPTYRPPQQVQQPQQPPPAPATAIHAPQPQHPVLQHPVVQPVHPVVQQAPPQPKTLLPPISAFDTSLPATSTVASLPNPFYQTPRYRSESVRPYSVYPAFP